MSNQNSDLMAKAKKLLENNHRVGVSHGIKYDYTCPSPRNYPHQWLWDSSFEAIVLTHFDIERSKKEIRTLLLKQRRDGFIPCVSIWENTKPLDPLLYVTMITQPPVIPLAALKVYEATKDVAFLEEVYPKLKSFIFWLKDHRDTNINNLVEIIHPWEAGCDSIPSFDKELGFKSPFPSTFQNYSKLLSLTLKYISLRWDEKKIFESKSFTAENVLFNSIYIQALASLCSIANILGKTDEKKELETIYEKAKSSLIKNCWSEKDSFFYDLDREGKQVKVKTVSGLMPLILTDLPKSIIKPLVEKHLLNKSEFWTEYPIPSVAKNEPTFNPNSSLILWRGPTWINTNWFLCKALENHGYHEESVELTEKTAGMIQKSGFMEFYNPLTGAGYGQPNFGWSTLITDMLV